MFRSERSLSIFNFKGLLVLSRLIPLRQAGFLCACAVLLALPLCLLDRWHLLLVITLTAFAGFAIGRVFRSCRPHLLGLIILVPGLFLLGETLFRFNYFGWDGLSYHRCRPAGYGHPWSTFEFSEETYTGLKARQTILFKGKPFTVNNLGFRGRDVDPSKNHGEFRIVVLGGSVSLGSGVADDESLFALLEKRIDAAVSERTVTVVNLSMGGVHPGNSLHALRNVGMALDPDMILFFLDRSSFSLGPPEETPRRVRKLQVPHSRLVMEPKYSFFANRFFLAGAVFSQAASLRGRSERRVSPDGRDLKAMELAYLREVLSTLRSVAGDRPVMLYSLRPIRNNLDAVAARFGMRAMSLPGSVMEGHAPAELNIYPGDPHPNALAHGLYADAFFEKLLAFVRETMAE